MLFKISLKNIKKSFKDYAVYFFTLILGVAIFYVFNAIDSQTVLLDVTSSTKKIIKMMTNVLSGVSVFVSFILGFLIIYASRFLIKRRNKEFGIYLTLGMSKRKISMILFFETLFIGILSLAVGLGLGVLLSQFMSLLVANMFEANMIKFVFTFSSSACIKTLIYFTIMYLLVMVFNTINISRCKLIDLLHSRKKSEKVKMKNPILCVIVFIISCTILGYAYYLVTAGVQTLDTVDKIFIPIGLGCVSTFFIFWSLSGLLIKIFTSMRNTYYKGLNSFTLRQFSSKINTTVFSTTIICLMLFITICVLSSALSIKNSLTSDLNKLTPVDIQISKIINLEDEYLEQGYTNDGIIETLNKYNFDLNSKLKDKIEFNYYKSADLTLKESLGSTYETTKSTYPFMIFDNQEKVIRLSDYNKIAKLYGNKEFTLNDDEYIIIADFGSMVSIRNEALKKKESLNIFGHNLVPKYTECQDGFIQIASSHINDGIIIVSDNVVDEKYLSHNVIVANYKADNKDGKQEIEDEINKAMNGIYSKTFITYNTKIDITDASVGVGAMVTFIGLYLGIIFLISSAAILALKELSESTDNKERFRMLRKLGTDEKMINKALFRQIGIFFMFPLLLALVHTVFGIKFCLIILEGLVENMTPSIIMTAIFLIVIYGGYFLITYECSKNIIKER